MYNGMLSFYFQVPARGPNITVIEAASSTSLDIQWEILDNNDANGLITEYAVCYKPEGNSLDICTCKNITTKVSKATLNELSKYTFYVVAVKASTKEGFGKLGNTVTERTSEDRKCPIYICNCLVQIGTT